MDSVSIYLYYSPGPKFEGWDYMSLPYGWTLVERNRLDDRTKLYMYEERFSGPSASKVEAREYIDGVLEQLRWKKVLKKYKILSKQKFLEVTL